MPVIWELLRRFWPVVLVGVVVFGIWWQIDSIVDERDEALVEVSKRNHELAVEKGRVAQAKQQGVREKTQRDEQYTKDLNFVVNAYLKDFSHVKKQDKKTISDLRIALTDSMRDHALRSSSDPAENDASQPPKTDGNTTVIGQDETDCTRDVKELELAGALCAADYNACKQYVDDENTRLGVESLVE